MMSGIPKVLIAPDAFKGSLSCVGVARAMSSGIARAWPNSQTRLLPMTDGGEGALDAIATGLDGSWMPATVIGPYGRELQADWWLSTDGLAVIEMARASGLSLSHRREPMVASSIGTGHLLRAALAVNPREIWLCCGGSATVDGGAGLLTGLGFELLDVHGQEIGMGGGSLFKLSEIRGPSNGTLPQLKVLCDVTNPLSGPEGAAFVYGPQKGADPHDVERLDEGLRHFGNILHRTFDKDPETLVGGGAAGGIPAALWAACDSQLCGGFETIAEHLGLADAVSEADLVITGEGRIDHQTPYGKTVGGLIEMARQRSVPVWGFGGQVTEQALDWCPDGVEFMPVTHPDVSVEYAMAHAEELIEEAVFQAARQRPWDSSRP